MSGTSFLVVISDKGQHDEDAINLDSYVAKALKTVKMFLIDYENGHRPLDPNKELKIQ